MQNGSNIGADRIVFDWRINRFPRLAIDLRIVIWSVPVSYAVAFHSSTALGLWMPLRPAKFWTAILCFSMLVPGCVYAEGIDTEHLFGFMIGTDVGNVGEREFQSQTTGRFSKSGDNYRAINQELELEFVPVGNFRIEVGGAFAAHDIDGTPGFEDRRQLAWQGISLDLRYRFLDRDTAPFGLTFAVENQKGIHNRRRVRGDGASASGPLCRRRGTLPAEVRRHWAGGVQRPSAICRSHRIFPVVGALQADGYLERSGLGAYGWTGFVARSR